MSDEYNADAVLADLYCSENLSSALYCCTVLLFSLLLPLLKSIRKISTFIFNTQQHHFSTVAHFSSFIFSEMILKVALGCLILALATASTHNNKADYTLSNVTVKVRSVFVGWNIAVSTYVMATRTTTKM